MAWCDWPHGGGVLLGRGFEVQVAKGMLPYAVHLVSPRGLAPVCFDIPFMCVCCVAAATQDVPPVIATPMYYLISVLRFDMFFLATVNAEVSPLMVIELLHRIVSVMQIYFGNRITENSIQENFATVYQVCCGCPHGGTCTHSRDGCVGSCWRKCWTTATLSSRSPTR